MVGVDLNMGCPKKFSMCGGMGAALLSNFERVEDIVKTLQRNVRSTLGLTCKIRLVKSEAKRVALAQNLEKLGIDALGVHARYIADRSHSTLARIGEVARVAQCVGIPCIYNGDVFRFSHIARARAHSGCASVMVARGAQWNVSLFAEAEALRPLDEVVREYMDVSMQFENAFQNSKYVVVKMVCGKRWLCKSPVSTAFMKAKRWSELKRANEMLTKALKERKEKKGGDDRLYTDPSVFNTL